MCPDVSFPHNSVLQEHKKYQCFVVHCYKNNYNTRQPWLNMFEITVIRLKNIKQILMELFHSYFQAK